jgi:hypothetical protein
MARERCVVIEEGNEARALVCVRDGPALFVVCLLAVRRELQVACTCPVFALGRDACRHVWAALVASDREGHLAAVASRQVELVRAPAASWPRLRR